MKQPLVMTSRLLQLSTGHTLVKADTEGTPLSMLILHCGIVTSSHRGARRQIVSSTRSTGVKTSLTLRRE